MQTGRTESALELDDFDGKPSQTQSENEATLETGDGIDEARLQRRIDMHIVPWLALLYLLSFLDRSNVGNANIFGLQKDLKMTDHEYSIGLTCFYVTYVFFEVPSNIVLKLTNPKFWISSVLVAWGLVTVFTGIVKNYSGFIIVRLFLGATEAGFLPAATFYLQQWYTRRQIASRFGFFFCAVSGAGAFGGLLARLINEMDGAGGLEGWRWIFILEGIVTVVTGLASFYVLYDYPSKAKFLSNAEKAFTVSRLQNLAHGADSTFGKKYILHAFMDWKVWAFAWLYLTAIIPGYSVAIFTPTIINQLGYSAARAQLLSVPPYIVSCFVIIANGIYSDRIGIRAPFIIVSATVSAIGFAILLGAHQAGVKYFAVFLCIIGTNGAIPIILIWIGGNVAGSTKSAVAVAIMISFGNFGGIISAFVYPKATGPRFLRGHSVMVASDVLMICIASFLWFYFTKENKRKEAEDLARGRPLHPEEIAANAHLAEKSSAFRFQP